MGAFRLKWMNQYKVQCTEAWTPTCTIHNWSDPLMKGTPGDLSLAIEQVQIFEINWSPSTYPTFSDQYLRLPHQKGRFGQICGGGSKMKCVPTTTFFYFHPKVDLNLSQNRFIFVSELFQSVFIFVPANPRWIGGYEILIFHCDSALFPDDDINLHICDIVRNSAGNMIWIVQ